MPERQRSAAGGGPQDALRDGLVEQGSGLRRGKPGYLGQHRRIDPLAEQNGRRLLGFEPFPMFGAGVPQRGAASPEKPVAR